MIPVKIQTNNFRILILLICSLILALSGHATAELTAKANHDHIEIDFFYHGSTVSVSGDADAGTDIVIKIASPNGHYVLKKKGKLGGLLWMNTGTLDFGNTPDFYGVYSTNKIEDILSAEELDRYVIGFPALSRDIEISTVRDGEERSKWFNEYVKYKESSHLYSVSSGGIKLTPKEGGQSYYIQTKWPYQAPPGEYMVTVYEVKDNRVVGKAETMVNVEQAGIVKSLAGMAKNRGGVYGLISIAAALAAGFGVGMIFRKGGGAH